MIQATILFKIIIILLIILIIIINYLKEKNLKKYIVLSKKIYKYDITFYHYGSHFKGLEKELSDIDMFLYDNKNNINDNIIFRDDLYNLIRN